MVTILLYLLVNLFVGGVTCFYGKKLYFPTLMLNVFMAVVALSSSVFDLNFMTMILTVAVAVLSAILAYSFYKVGTFLIGGLLGGSLSLFLISFLPSFISAYSGIVFVTMMIVFGLLAVKWCDFFIIISTSFNGAYTISASLYFLILNIGRFHDFMYIDGIIPTMANLNNYINNEFMIQYSLPIFITTVVISIFAIGYQIQHFIKEECR